MVKLFPLLVLREREKLFVDKMNGINVRRITHVSNKTEFVEGCFICLKLKKAFVYAIWNANDGLPVGVKNVLSILLGNDRFNVEIVEYSALIIAQALGFQSENPPRVPGCFINPAFDSLG